jgi:tellurite resistance protein TerC
MTPTQIMWIGFGVLIFASLALDLGIFHRKAKSESFRQAMAWVLVWFMLAMLFNAGIWYEHGPQKALEFTAGYLIEISLSMDNVFVFVTIFSYFAVPPESRHKILFWGILGAMILRGVMIWLGIEMIEHMSWIIYIFGAFLVFTGFKMAFKGEEKIEPEHNPVVKLFRRFVPMTHNHRSHHFFVREHGKLLATPICLVLACVETSDVVFAVDSVPAILAITRDPFIVYTSNIFAILGLRSLYFVLAHAVNKFHLLHYGLGAVLVFVGAKMILEHMDLTLQLANGHTIELQVGTLLSLVVVGSILLLSIIASLLRPAKK